MEQTASGSHVHSTFGLQTANWISKEKLVNQYYFTKVLCPASVWTHIPLCARAKFAGVGPPSLPPKQVSRGRRQKGDAGTGLQRQRAF